LEDFRSFLISDSQSLAALRICI